MMTIIGNFLIYFLVTVGIVLLSGRRHLARDKRLAAVVGALVILLPAGQAVRGGRVTYHLCPVGDVREHCSASDVPGIPDPG